MTPCVASPFAAQLNIVDCFGKESTPSSCFHLCLSWRCGMALTPQVQLLSMDEIIIIPLFLPRTGMLACDYGNSPLHWTPIQLQPIYLSVNDMPQKEQKKRLKWDKSIRLSLIRINSRGIDRLECGRSRHPWFIRGDELIVTLSMDLWSVQGMRLVANILNHASLADGWCEIQG